VSTFFVDTAGFEVNVAGLPRVWKKILRDSHGN